MIPDRRLRTNEKPNRTILLVWLAVSALLLVIAWDNISQRRFLDPDDTMRLVQVRDLMAGQGWFDLHQYRINPPEGVLMHWSRLVDVPLLLLITVLTPLFGSADAEIITMIVMPLLILGIILLAIGRLAWRLFDLETAIFACLAVALWPPILAQVQPMRIDHHGWQVACVAIAAWALVWRNERLGAAAAGMAMGLGTMISLEILPVAAAFGVILGLRWLRDYRQRGWLVVFMLAMAATLVTTFALTRGWVDLASHCDAMSPPYLAFFVIAAIGTWGLARLPQMPRTALLGGFAVLAAAGGAVAFLIAPQCASGPFATLDPLVQSFWYQNVREGQPIWRQSFEQSIPAVLQALVALAASFAILARQQDWLRQWWAEYTLLLVLVTIVGFMTFRSLSFPAVLGAIPLGWLARQMLRMWRTSNNLGVKLGTALVIYVILLPTVPFQVARQFTNEPKPPLTSTVVGSSCELDRNVPLLNAIAPATLLTPLDIGPAILRGTHHSVVATGHHRAPAAMHDTLSAFLGTPDEARLIAAKHGATHIVVCTDLAEVGNYVARSPDDGLMKRLLDGDTPDWLVPVEIGGPESLRAWRVASPAPAPAHAAMPAGTSSPRR